MTRPAASIVLATRDRDYVLAHTLAHMARALSASTLDVELVIVDNGSSDSTGEVLSFFRAHLPLVTDSEPEAGKNRALNRALGLARGELIVFTDDDVVPASGWIDNLAAAAGRWEAYEIFGGRIVPRYPPGAAPPLDDGDFAGWAYSQWDPGSDEAPTTQLPFGPNFAVRSSALADVTLDEQIGPGAGPMGSETSLLRRLVERGCRIVYVPSATVHHLVLPHQMSRTYLLRRSFRLGRGIARWSRDESSPTLAGVPRYLWRDLVESWVVGKLRFRDAQARLRAELLHQRARGKIFEYRRIHR